jgi:DNA-binding Lrp family transcriptional regulator
MGPQQWAKVPEGVAYAGLDVTAMRVLIIMAAKAGRDRITWITQRTMGERLGLHPTTVGRAIRRLEKLDLVQRCGKVVIDYDLGTWIQKYKVAPYLPEVRLGGTRSASRQGADVRLGRRHSVPYESVPYDISEASGEGETIADAPWKDFPGTTATQRYRAWMRDQERIEEERAAKASGATVGEDI